jgi:hypothetical protein
MLRWRDKINILKSGEENPMVRLKGWGAYRGMGPLGRSIICLLVLLLISACSQSSKGEEEVRRDLQDLKKEVRAMAEKLDKLQASQQTLLEFLKKSPSSPETAFLPPQSPMMAPPPATPPPGGAQPLTISQLLAGKDQYLGTRVTVRGQVGPVLVHHKSLILKSPQGMVEVFFGKIADQKLIQYLTSATLEQPVTVTGIVNLAAKTGSARLRIDAESLDF